MSVDEEVAREHAQASPRPDPQLCETKRVRSMRQHTYVKALKSAYVSIHQHLRVRIRSCVKPSALEAR